MNIWPKDAVAELSRSLEEEARAAMSPSPTNIDRFGMGSPDSGIHVTNFEYDFHEALLGEHDPIFSDIPSLTSGIAVEVIPADHPVVISDFTAVNESFEESMVKMEEEDEQEEEEEEEEFEDNVSNYSDEENLENTSSNIPKNHPVEIHSYSIIKQKKEHNFKAKSRAIAPIARAKQPSGKKYKVSISQKKRKLYEMEPLVDPVAEKNRLNALNAKKNRDKKKQQLAEAESEISRLREENEELKSEADEMRDELEAARREMAELRAQMKLQQPGSRLAFLDDREE